MRALSQISIHALLAESDLCNCLYPMRAFISIHALLAESDKLWTSFAPNPKTFLSTLSLRRATYQKRSSKTHDRQFLSTLSLRRATHGTNSGTNSTLFLSTLSLRRATFIVVALRHIHSVISIHALLAESDNILCVISVQIGGFLSTLSLRRATG